MYIRPISSVYYSLNEPFYVCPRTALTEAWTKLSHLVWWKIANTHSQTWDSMPRHMLVKLFDDANVYWLETAAHKLFETRQPNWSNLNQLSFELYNPTLDGPFPMSSSRDWSGRTHNGKQVSTIIITVILLLLVVKCYKLYMTAQNQWDTRAVNIRISKETNYRFNARFMLKRSAFTRNTLA